MDDPGLSYYKTSCEHALDVGFVSPLEYGFKYCPFCGKPIEHPKTKKESVK